MAKVFLICGRICAGKSHYAKRICELENAVILSCDELTFALFDGQLGDAHDTMSARMERYLMGKSVEIVRAGTSVILDWGFWTAQRRCEVRAYYAERQIACEMHYIDTPLALWRQQIETRNKAVRNGLSGAYVVDEGLLAKLESRFQEPTHEEIDVWYQNVHE